MTRTLIVVVVLAALCGGTTALLRHRSVAEPVTPDQPAADEPSSTPASHDAGLAAVRHEFRLNAADVHADREHPALAADRQGRVLMAWASQTGELERTLYLARSADGGKTFDQPSAWRKVPIYKYSSGKKKDGKAPTYSTHVLPRLVSTDDAFWLGWVEAISGGPEVAYFVARSDDGGRTFAPPERVHSPRAGRPGFTTLAASSDGAILAGWLDGRGGQLPFASVRHAGSAGFETEQLVYPGPDGKGICPCCDLAIARAGDGRALVAFRNAASGKRDIWIARSRAGGAAGFEPAIPVGAAPWEFDGCPHDGPSLAADGDRVFVIWMDAHTGRGRVYAASSTLADWTFAPHPVGETTSCSQGHPRAVILHGRLVAAWDESIGEDGTKPDPPAGSAADQAHGHGHHATLTGAGRAVMLAVATDPEGHLPSAFAISPKLGAFQLNPALAVAHDGGLLAAWTEMDTEGKRMVFARVDPDRLDARTERRSGP